MASIPIVGPALGAAAAGAGYCLGFANVKRSLAQKAGCPVKVAAEVAWLRAVE